jgi:hypothetical protein
MQLLDIAWKMKNTSGRTSGKCLVQHLGNIVLEKALRDYIRNVVTMSETTLNKDLIRNILKIFGSSAGVGLDREGEKRIE